MMCSKGEDCVNTIPRLCRASRVLTLPHLTEINDKMEDIANSHTETSL
jgi:hypothetical protein